MTNQAMVFLHDSSTENNKMGKFLRLGCRSTYRSCDIFKRYIIVMIYNNVKKMIASDIDHMVYSRDI